MQRITRNKVCVYVLTVILTVAFLLLLVSKPTAIAFIKGKGGSTSQLITNYDSNKSVIRTKLTNYAADYYLYSNDGDKDIEHIFAQSWAKDIGKDIIVNDYFNLRLANHEVNNYRGNRGFAIVPHTFETEIIVNYKICGWRTNEYFEPTDAYKGDVARALLYMYYNYNLNQTDIEGRFDIDEMKAWAKLDKISDSEKQYNKNIQSNEDYTNIFLLRQSLVNYL